MRKHCRRCGNKFFSSELQTNQKCSSYWCKDCFPLRINQKTTHMIDYLTGAREYTKTIRTRKRNEQQIVQ